MTDFAFLASDDSQVAASILKHYMRAFEVLSAATDFSPHNPEIAVVVSALREAVSVPVSQAVLRAVLEHSFVAANQQQMWRFLSRAEGAAEVYYASCLSKDTYKQFKDFDKYDMMVDAELECIPHCRKGCCDHQGIVFIGAGALPLTAILMHQKTGKKVTCLDCDPVAAQVGREFILRCGLSAGMTYKLQAGETYEYSQYSTIFIASLVENKNGVMQRVMASNVVANNHPKTVAVRSVEGIHALLYPPVDETGPNAMNIVFERRSRRNTTSGFINTTLFADILAKANRNDGPRDVKRLSLP